MSVFKQKFHCHPRRYLTINLNVMAINVVDCCGLIKKKKNIFIWKSDLVSIKVYADMVFNKYSELILKLENEECDVKLFCFITHTFNLIPQFYFVDYQFWVGFGAALYSVICLVLV